MQSTLNPRRTALPIPTNTRTLGNVNEPIPGSLEDSGVGSDDDAGISMRNRNNNYFNNDSFDESIAPPPMRMSFPSNDPTIEFYPPKPERMLSLLKRKPKKKTTPSKNDPSQALLREIPKFNDCVPETPISMMNCQRSLNTALGSGPIDRFVRPIPPEELHKPVPTIDEYKKKRQPHPMVIMKPSPAEDAIFKKPFLPVRPTKPLSSIDNNPYVSDFSRKSEEPICSSFDEVPLPIRKKKQSTSPMVIKSVYDNALKKPFNSVVVVPHVYNEEIDNHELDNPKPTFSNDDSLFDGTVIPALERKTTRQLVSIIVY